MAMIIKSSRTIAALGVTAAVAVLVSGCSSSFKGSARSAAAASPTSDAAHGFANGGTVGSAPGLEPAAAATSAAAPAANSAPAAAAPAAGSAPAGGGANSAAPQALLKNRDVIFTADMTVRTTDIKGAVGRVSLIATGAGGVVFGVQESLSAKDPNNPGQASATVVLKMPQNVPLDGILDQIGKVGTELSRNEHADDVTAQVVDVNSRIGAANDSLTRLRQLFQHAGNVTDLANVENQIAQREAELESLEAQQRTFASQTAQATITVTLVAAPPVAAAVAPVKKAHVFGFVRGLRNGWHAFTKTASAIATALGALLPFFVVVLLFVPIAVIVRRRMMATRRAASAQAPSTGPAA